MESWSKVGRKVGSAVGCRGSGDAQWVVRTPWSESFVLCYLMIGMGAITRDVVSLVFPPFFDGMPCHSILHWWCPPISCDTMHPWHCTGMVKFWINSALFWNNGTSWRPWLRQWPKDTGQSSLSLAHELPPLGTTSATTPHGWPNSSNFRPTFQSWFNFVKLSPNFLKLIQLRKVNLFNIGSTLQSWVPT